MSRLMEACYYGVKSWQDIRSSEEAGIYRDIQPSEIN
jgi:hypothetical protein